MTIQEVITQLDAVKPHKYDVDTVVRWLSDLDGLLYHECISWHECRKRIKHGPYNPQRLNTVLIVPEPYSDITSMGFITLPLLFDIFWPFSSRTRPWR